MSVMNLISKFDVEGLGAGPLAIVTPPGWAVVVELAGVDAVVAFRADGAVGDSGWPEHAATVTATPTTQTR